MVWFITSLRGDVGSRKWQRSGSKPPRAVTIRRQLDPAWLDTEPCRLSVSPLVLLFRLEKLEIKTNFNFLQSNL